MNAAPSGVGRCEKLAAEYLEGKYRTLNRATNGPRKLLGRVKFAQLAPLFTTSVVVSAVVG